IVNVGPLGAGATSSVISATWSSPALGAHTIWVEVDYGNAVPEADETNNLQSGTTTVYNFPATSLRIGTPMVVATATYIAASTAERGPATTGPASGSPSEGTTRSSSGARTSWGTSSRPGPSMSSWRASPRIRPRGST